MEYMERESVALEVPFENVAQEKKNATNDEQMLYNKYMLYSKGVASAAFHVVGTGVSPQLGDGTTLNATIVK